MSPDMPEPMKEQRVKVSKSQVKIYTQLQLNQQQTQQALTNFVLGVLAGHDVEGFAAARLDGNEIVYTPIASLIGA